MRLGFCGVDEAAEAEAEAAEAEAETHILIGCLNNGRAI